MKISANDMTIWAVTNTPKASGVSNRARTIVVIGATSFAAISVMLDHLVAFMTFLFNSLDI